MNILLLLLFPFISTQSSTTERATFIVDTSRTGESRVEWEGHSLLGKITGVNRQISGSVTIDLLHPFQDPRISLFIQLAGFDTGIALRNRHMREKYLQTGLFPTAIFEAREVRPDSGSLAEGIPFSGSVRGTLSLHGMSKEAELPFSATLSGPGPGILQISSEFEIRLTDYNIPTPRFLINKMEEKVRVKVKLKLKQGF